MEDDTLKHAHASGWPLIITGVISMVAGILAFVYPDKTLLVLALITGINLFLLSLVGVVGALASGRDGGGSRVPAVVVGILGMLAGLVIVRRPGETLLVILLAVGIWLVLSGVAEAMVALLEPEDRGLRLLDALVSVVMGGLLLALPELSLGTVAALCGVAFLVRGAVAVYAGFQLRGGRTVAPQAAPAGMTT